jgi:hypothetical protein
MCQTAAEDGKPGGQQCGSEHAWHRSPAAPTCEAGAARHSGQVRRLRR